MTLPQKLFGADSIGLIYLEIAADGLLHLTCDDDNDAQATVKLDLRKVRELRLALTRHENAMGRRPGGN